MAELIPLNSFRYWLKTTYPKIYDENKTEYELLSALKNFYQKTNTKIATITANLAITNADNSIYYNSFYNWFVNLNSADPNLSDKILAALRNGTISSLADGIEKADNMVFENIF